jgi:hypothetical protein
MENEPFKPAMKLTINTYCDRNGQSTYDLCPCNSGSCSYQYKELGNMCVNCWLNLTPAERAVLRGEPEPQPIQVTEHKTIIYPINKPNALWRGMKIGWSIVVTGYLLLLLWKQHHV